MWRPSFEECKVGNKTIKIGLLIISQDEMLCLSLKPSCIAFYPLCEKNFFYNQKRENKATVDIERKGKNIRYYEIERTGLKNSQKAGSQGNLYRMIIGF